MDNTRHRAYSVLEIKSIDEEKRIIEGVATTPSTDRVGDIVEPLGAQFKLPVPFLWQHGKDPFVGQTPVGNVIAATITSDGIPVRIQMERSDQPGRLKDILDFAWEAVKKRLVRGLSIGFNPIEMADIAGTWGQRFIKWEWLELSGVTIAANQDASIVTIKSIAAAHLAAPGNGDGRPTPRAAGTRAASAVRTSMKTIPDQIKDFEATRAAKSARMTELMNGAAEGGTTLDETQSAEYDGLEGEVKAVDQHLTRLRGLDAANKAAAVPVSGATPAEAAAARGAAHPVITVRENLPPGIGFARSVMCELSARMENRDVIAVAKRRYPDHAALHRFLEQKAAVPAGSSSGATYAGPLVYPDSLASEFIDFLTPQTVVGKFGTNGIPSLTRVPFNVRVNRQINGGDAYWVGEGKGKPLTTVGFDFVTLTHDKVATIAVLTKEVVRLSTPSAELLVRNALAKAVVRRIDRDFIDPAKAAVANVSPASITHGLVALSSAGTSSDNVITDVGNILQAYIEANMDPSGLVLVMPATLAMVLGLMRNALGQKVFPDITMNGGVLEGLPVITTQHAANSSGAGNLVIAVHAPSILLADDGNVAIDASDQVSLQMSDAPTIDATSGTGASLVSMWQTNSLAVRAEREITWVKGRDEAVVYMDDVNWASVGSPA